MEYILLTGGTGFIGSHTAVELINSGYNIIIIDNLSNSNNSVIDRLNLITGQDIIFYECDVTNSTDISLIFINHKIIGVIHFAAFKAVGESVVNPLKYYQNNFREGYARAKTPPDTDVYYFPNKVSRGRSPR